MRGHPATGTPDELPLAPLQRGLYFHTAYDAEGQDIYTTQLTLEVDGELDAVRLREACRALQRRHDGLRAGFRAAASGEPVQFITPDPPLDWRLSDLTGLPPDARAGAAVDAVHQERARRFDLARPPLIRFLLLRLDERRWRFALTSHHLILDGWSTSLVVDELWRLYGWGDAVCEQLPPAPSYTSYLDWLADTGSEEAREAWGAALAGVDGPTLVAPEAAGQAATIPERVLRTLPPATSAALTGVARDCGVTLNTVVLVAWGLVLRRLTGRDDVLFGMTVSGRMADVEGVESLVGLLVNTLPARVAVRAGELLSELLERVQDDQIELFEHHHLGLSEIHRLTGRQALFDTTTAFENYPAGGRGHDAALDTGLRCTVADGYDATHYPLSVVCTPGDTLGVRLEFQRAHFTRDRAERIADWFVRLLAGIAHDPHRDVDALAEQAFLPEDERHRLLVEWNDTAAPVPATALPALIEAQADRNPRAPAVIHAERTTTYAELDARANQLARLLLDAGAGTETTVALLLPRTPDALIALFAVLKAGAAYLPLDPRQPADRLARVLSEARPRLVVTSAAVRSLLPPGTAPIVVDDSATVSDLAARDRARIADRERGGPILPHHAAYVIHTSGTTGTPKGVVVEHAGVVNLIGAYQAEFGADSVARVLGSISLAFDAHIEDTVLPLALGGCVELVDDLLTLVERDGWRGSLLTTVPSALTSLLPALTGELAVRRVHLGGEPLSDALVREIRRRIPGCAVTNVYGPTETTVFALTWQAGDTGPEGNPPVGHPIRNTRAYVLDERLSPVPVGVPGELHLAGAGVARGYARRPGWTAERFVACPFGEPGERMYRTGDLVRYRADGAIEFLGRLDDQVKIRGHRVEPADVEAVLLRHPLVVRAVVTARDDRAGGRRLVAHVVAVRPGLTLDHGDLLRHARALLPDYLVPSAFVQTERIPLTPSGKLDRAALPAPPPAPRATAVALGPREEILSRLFAETLGVVAPDPAASFFDLGGDSLLATRLIGRIRAVTGDALSVRALFEAPSVTALARRLGDDRPDAGPGRGTQADLAPLLPLREGPDRRPLFCVHAVSGLAWPYARLLPHLDPGLPVYGLQAADLAEPGSAPRKPDEVVRRHVESMRSVQRHGPYRLFGWSLGGQLAHAIAARLTEEGERVELLVLLDTHLPTDRRGPAGEDDGEALRALGFSAAGESPASLAVLGDAVVTGVRAAAGSAAEFLRGGPPPVLGGGTGVLFFRATGEEGGGADPAAWQPYCTGPVVPYDIACGHHELLEAGPLGRITALLGPGLSERHLLGRG
ncbi:amino acid adenylation domain-containing protein [Streptomyces cinnabarinus]|uniref:Amino acid adenylation domain-containing protein n=1 Tax=Streptomyces cinnabarinus TaxID=67287 RepID=A0ABY7K600_9ACTN|nr:amino acid adenylation domain-containing protein [Streptomyces cinnabarinus]WAZ19949.1 amino acid adenylation domain-containing protein [Streptomyces cinnabarinus]